MNFGFCCSSVDSEFSVFDFRVSCMAYYLSIFLFFLPMRRPKITAYFSLSYVGYATHASHFDHTVISCMWLHDACAELEPCHGNGDLADLHVVARCRECNAKERRICISISLQARHVSAAASQRLPPLLGKRGHPLAKQFRRLRPHNATPCERPWPTRPGPCERPRPTQSAIFAFSVHVHVARGHRYRSSNRWRPAPCASGTTRSRLGPQSDQDRLNGRHHLQRWRATRRTISNTEPNLRQW